MPNWIPTFILMCALICGALATRASAGEWTVADVDSLPMDIFGRTVWAGRDLIVHTAATIGPDARDPARRYSGNGLECESCHLDAGTKKFGLPLAGIWGMFPLFIGRENEVRTLEDRINGCMERSMNGRALPPDGPEMKAMLTYIRFISAGVPVGQSIEGRGRAVTSLARRGQRSKAWRASFPGSLRGVPPGEWTGPALGAGGSGATASLSISAAVGTRQL